MSYVPGTEGTRPKYAVQPHARRILLRESQSRLLLAPLPLRCNAPRKSHTPLIITLTNAPPGALPASKPPLPLLPSRIRSHLPLVSATPINPHIPLRPHNHHSPVPPPRPGRGGVGRQRNMESSSCRPRRMCCRTCGVVRARCVDEGDGRRTHLVQ